MKSDAPLPSRMELMELLADAWLRAAEAEMREQVKDVFIEELLRCATRTQERRVSHSPATNTDTTTH